MAEKVLGKDLKQVMQRPLVKVTGQLVRRKFTLLVRRTAPSCPSCAIDHCEPRNPCWPKDGPDQSGSSDFTESGN